MEEEELAAAINSQGGVCRSWPICAVKKPWRLFQNAPGVFQVRSSAAGLAADSPGNFNELNPDTQTRRHADTLVLN